MSIEAEFYTPAELAQFLGLTVIALERMRAAAEEWLEKQRQT
jgi:hypothetical protein